MIRIENDKEFHPKEYGQWIFTDDDGWEFGATGKFGIVKTAAKKAYEVFKDTSFGILHAKKLRGIADTIKRHLK